MASIDNKLELDAYRDYFVTNSFNKYLNFKMTTSFSYKGEIPEEKVKKVMTDFFNSSLVEKNQVIPMFEFFQKNQLKNVLNKYTKKLLSSGIHRGKFSINLLFTPQFKQQLNYNQELSTNSLIRVDDFSLKRVLNKKEEHQVEEIVATPIPFTKEKYQYSGGAITIYLDAIDLRKSIYSGHIRYRRYFRANNLSTADLDIKNEYFELDYFKLNKITKKIDNFITVDLYKNFNSKDLIPINNHLDFTFGKLLSTNSNETNISTGNFYLNGYIPTSDKKREAKIRIKKLTYSFKDKEFTKDSKVLINFRNSEGIDADKERFNLKNVIRTHLAKDIIKELELDHFHKDINKAGEIK